jgi:hypothetical protein
MRAAAATNRTPTPGAPCCTEEERGRERGREGAFAGALVSVCGKTVAQKTVGKHLHKVSEEAAKDSQQQTGLVRAIGLEDRVYNAFS